MPTKPGRMCRRPGCLGIVRDGRCSVCGPLVAKREDRRASKHERGYGYWWSNRHGTGMRDVFLAQHPLCAQCEREGRTEPATDVDHVTPHRGDQAVLRDWTNLEALCHSCHSRKTSAGG